MVPDAMSKKTLCIVFLLYFSRTLPSCAQQGPEFVPQAGHTAEVKDIVFSPDGKTLASVAGEHWMVTAYEVKLWDVETGQVRRNFWGHTNGVITVAFSPDGETLATGGADHTVKFWRVATGELLRTLEAHSSSVLAVAFSPDGKLFATGGADKALKIWRLGAEVELLYNWTEFAQGVCRVTFSPEGEILASASGETVKLWDVETGTRIRYMDQAWQVYDLAFAPDGVLLAAANEFGEVDLWEVATGGHESFVAPKSSVDWHHLSAYTSVAFSPSGRWMAAADQAGLVHLWNPKNDLISLRSFQEHAREVAFSPDGKILATTWEELRIFEGHGDDVNALAFSPDGRMLASASSDKTVKLWDVARGALLCTFTGHSSWVRTVAFLPGGQQLVSGDYDGGLEYLDCGCRLLASSHALGDDDYLTYTPEGYFVASSGGIAKAMWRVDGAYVALREVPPSWHQPSMVERKLAGFTVDPPAFRLDGAAAPFSKE